MNRKIKFRQPIFDRDDKFLEWHYWGIGIDGTTFKGPLSGGNIRADKIPSYQYTGLKDKNGKEIYEGDVITTPVRLAQENHDATGQVQFLGTGFVSAGLGEYRGGHYPIQYNSEILGNIYENPDLIAPSTP